METLETIRVRRSVRSFSSKEVTDEIIDKLMHAAMASPSAVDRRPWFYYVIKDEETKQKVIDNMQFGKYKSPIIIIPCINELKTIPFMKELAALDLASSTENILLAATDLGLGSVWCAIYPNKSHSKAIQKALDMPLSRIPFSAIYLGYPNENDKGKIKDKYDESKIKII